MHRHIAKPENMAAFHRAMMDYVVDFAKTASSCKSGRRVGAIVTTKRGHIASRAHNGEDTKRKGARCHRRKSGAKPGKAYHLCGCKHAEVKALERAVEAGYVPGAVYVSHRPCASCLLVIADHGIDQVFYRHDYPDTDKIVEFVAMKKKVKIWMI